MKQKRSDLKRRSADQEREKERCEKERCEKERCEKERCERTIPKKSLFFKEGQEDVPFWHKQVTCLLL